MASLGPAGLSPLTLNELMHTCVSLAIAADVRVLQRMLGHASAALTPARDDPDGQVR